MKTKLLLIISCVLLGTNCLMAEDQAFVVWCSNNHTLYFDYGEVPAEGGTYNGQTVTRVWSGTGVTGIPSETDPGWHQAYNGSPRGNCTTVIITDNFKQVKPTHFFSWFSGFISLEKIIGLENLDTSQATSMNCMFSTSGALTSLDLSSFDTHNVTNMVSMFNSCQELKEIIVDETKWNTDNISTALKDKEMFDRCSALVGEKGTTYDSYRRSGEYARIDGGSASPGYLSRKNVTQPTVDVGGAGWSTYYKSSDTTNRLADNETTVYTVTLEGTALTLVEVEDRIVKAGQGVLLKRTASGNATLTATTAPATDSYYATNALSGVDADTEQESGYVYYVLSNNGGKLNFYRYKSTKKLGAHKAFIRIATTSGAPNSLSFGEDSETTGISETETMSNVKNKTFYSLNGQKAIQPMSGVNIVNGKKVIVK